MENEINVYEILSRFREPLLTRIIQSIGLPRNSLGLDAGCGIGFTTNLLRKTLDNSAKVLGVDLSTEFIQYAKKTYPKIKFEEGDINKLSFNDNTFDWIWSTDTVWIGPEDTGCPSENPLSILNEYRRVVKPDGLIALLFWSSQKFLPGYPLLEANLNATTCGTAPFKKDMDPSYHFLNCKQWLINAGLHDVNASTLVHDINAPLSSEIKKSLLFLCDMLWGEAESEVNQEDWRKYQNIIDPDSENHILNIPHYYGFYSYTIFTGRNSKN